MPRGTQGIRKSQRLVLRVRGLAGRHRTKYMPAAPQDTSKKLSPPKENGTKTPGSMSFASIQCWCRDSLTKAWPLPCASKICQSTPSCKASRSLTPSGSKEPYRQLSHQAAWIIPEQYWQSRTSRLPQPCQPSCCRTGRWLRAVDFVCLNRFLPDCDQFSILALVREKVCFLCRFLNQSTTNQSWRQRISKFFPLSCPRWLSKSELLLSIER